ncbi:UDP-N-acetylmuramate--L-alanine ligase [Endomicrobiia bacterium]|uniref:UDP-N-acetylmuramate--L-alanine ligase n=1 Tax=Endomicrobium trichonymphae TaxID=1408204 RepID=UPI0008664FC3|nr:UDP-N-acetylmuramate--L-alanine ligase [Candidatus Endomicrobium trichonymphae]GHT06951.1 UDP-N-acetylmuramate--L-alanine ligase [Endomicrobiia bacterium]BAV59179.1 UDP-N-acetylmuramate-L-alanine ligase [Candidatus Endomicrobium trichonymphae]GHT13485.1 UDP-N-acetylmuramate--L-alanine ligase [Endomicrobiia bacterium]GHT18872.1 UDP-N-acetylmuramate--L-alanine ligase [Endomicrobiia bacterium]GHT23160.1 UDP-N-acetylmuramate--L-alanine ligase [Endomicrobiia bacterium]
MFLKNQNIHFVGIGGSGMSGIAEVLINLGHRVSGSDLKKTDVTEYLKAVGAKIYIGHSCKNIKSAEVVVTSTAISRNNPEVVAALKKRIPIIARIEMLVELARLKYAVTITGTHGKTTTTSLTSLVLHNGGLDPTIVIGGRLKNLKTNAKLGRGDYIVVEADESDGSFLRLSPIITVVTNIDNDHLDYYDSMENLKEAFVKHINCIPFYGTAIICSDNEVVRKIIPQITRRYITYGLMGNPDIKASNIKVLKNHTSFDVFYMRKKVGSVCMKILGKHNVSNSLAAIGVGLRLGISFSSIADTINKFDGVSRRLEIKGEKNGMMVIDDYGHHPTEVAATLRAIKLFWPERRLVVLFQPHRYTRTKQLFNEFGRSFSDADFVKVLDIYSAGEQPIDEVTSDLILESLLSNKCKAEKFSDLEEFSKGLSVGDVVLTLGAGDVWKKGEELLALI